MKSEEIQNNVATTEELLSDFFFLIFIPNPNKELVRIIIDDGTIKLYANTKKFINIIRSTMGEKSAIIAKNCCDTYGCYYLIDRCENLIRKLSTSSEDNVINLKNLHNDILAAKKAGEVDSKLRESYMKTLNGNQNNELKKGQLDRSITVDKYSSTIIYNQQKLGNYRPY